MGGIFGVASKSSCILDLFFGIDYHSHLGTRRGGMAVYDKKRGFDRVIHNIENAPFRTKFDGDIGEMEGNLGIGCISDNEPQPLLVRSHLGNFAITTVGKINNMDELIANCFKNGCTHFLEMSGGSVNPTEMVAALINQKDNMIEGIRYAQEVIEGSMTMLILTPKGILAARDRLGRTPLIVGKKEDACCVSFESFAYLNLGYEDLKELGPGEIVAVTPDGVETLQKPGEEMRICSFLWVYYGYPTSAYEGVNVEEMRYHCGDMLARRDRGEVNPDIVAGVPDSGIAHAIGYANQSGVPFARPFIKYTPTWPRSFMPTQQSQRNLIARMKLIPVHRLIKDKSLLMIDDSIVRGTQLRETTEFLYRNGAKEVHIRPACPPLLYGCKYLNFSRSKSEMDLITRRVIAKREGENVSDKVLADYADPNSTNYKEITSQSSSVINSHGLLSQHICSLVIKITSMCSYLHEIDIYCFRILVCKFLILLCSGFICFPLSFCPFFNPHIVIINTQIIVSVLCCIVHSTQAAAYLPGNIPHSNIISPVSAPAQLLDNRLSLNQNASKSVSACFLIVAAVNISNQRPDRFFADCPLFCFDKLLRFFSCFERFELRSLEAFYLCLARWPVCIYSRFDTGFNCIVF